MTTGGRSIAGDDLVGDGRPSVTAFLLSRRDYTVQQFAVDENGDTLFVARPLPVHLARDQALAVGVGPDETIIAPPVPLAPADE